MLEKARMLELEELADTARLRLTVHNQFPVPMKVVLQRISDASLERRISVTVSDHKMAMDQAFTYFERGKAKIVLSGETFADLGIASRADFTLAHELCHALIHSSKGAMSRSLSGRDYRALAGSKRTRILEAEANYFASAFLMPRCAITSQMTSDEIASKFRVSKRAAEIRLEAIKKFA
jgi:Zn-dependent peptidase ImmA (M78 family)